jgi:threonine dehydrogenase-like Zn-dependent dehydrogenase
MKVYPRVNGYCNVAEVVAVGAAVVGVRAGDRISTHQSHRSAFRCDAGRINAVLSPHDDAVEQATLYLWHLGYYPLLRGGVQAGHNVAVLGLGTLGLTAVAMSKLAGCNVLAFSDRSSAHQKALEFGADLVLAKTDMAMSQEKLREVTNGVGVDLVISTSNSWKDWEFALQTARDGGAIAVLGFPGRGLDPPEFNPLGSQYLYDKELTIIPCGNPPVCDVPPRDLRFTLKRNYSYLSGIIRQQRVPAKAIVSDVVDWSELKEVYRRMEQREDGLLTVALKWR